MYDWYRNIQNIIDEIDACIKNHDGESLALGRLAKNLGYKVTTASTVRSWHLSTNQRAEFAVGGFRSPRLTV